MVRIDCCYECERRSVGCHGSCEAYQKQRAARDAELDAERAQKEKEYFSWLERKRAKKRLKDQRYSDKKKAEREGRA